MKQGRTLIELATELQRQQTTKKDFIAPTKQLQMVNNPALGPVAMKVNGSGEFGINKHAHAQIAVHTKIPQQYYDRMKEAAPALLADNVNHWLHENPTNRMVRTLDGNVRAFLSNRYRAIDNFDLATVVLPELERAHANVVSTEVTESHLYIKTVTATRNRVELRPGDWLEFGVVISNSEIGAGSVKIEPYINRLICTNGMIAPDKGINKYHVGRASAELEAAYEVFRTATKEADDRAFFMKVQDAVRASFDSKQAQQIAGRLEGALEAKIDGKVEKVIEVVTKRFTLTDGDGGNILRNLIMGGELTQWGLANAITATANDEADYEKATSLERIGGEVAFLPQPDFAELVAA
jgi:hypothetical protein